MHIRFDTALEGLAARARLRHEAMDFDAGSHCLRGLTLPEALLRHGVSAADTERFFRGTSVTLARDATLFLQGDAGQHWYEVISGAVRLVRQDEHGRRQIPEICLPGEIVGLYTAGTPHAVSAEIASPGGAVLMRRSCAALSAWIGGNPQRLSWLLEDARRRMELTYSRLHVLGCLDSLQRVASFLLEMEARLACAARRPAQAGGVPRLAPCCGGGASGLPGGFILPMQARDISDYLGATAETVSRSFGLLRRRGLADVTAARRVRILDRAELRALCAGKMQDMPTKAAMAPAGGLRPRAAIHAGI